MNKGADFFVLSSFIFLVAVIMLLPHDSTINYFVIGCAALGALCIALGLIYMGKEK